MNHGLPEHWLRCEGQRFAMLIGGKYLRIRCTDKRCAQACEARERGSRCYHYFDLSQGGILMFSVFEKDNEEWAA